MRSFFTLIMTIKKVNKLKEYCRLAILCDHYP
jgi:hypothetical protein